MRAGNAERVRADFTYGGLYPVYWGSLAAMAIIALMDFSGVALASALALLQWISPGVAQDIGVLAQTREHQARSALVLEFAWVLGWVGFVYFLYAVPMGKAYEYFLQGRRFRNLVQTTILCVVGHLTWLFMINLPLIDANSIRTDGPLHQRWDRLIGTDLGLGFVAITLKVMTAYCLAVVLKTAVAYVQSLRPGT